MGDLGAVKNGVLVLDKPAGVSSAEVVNQVKRALGAKRAGHGGTLDPFATGVLPICLGEATKLAGYLLADDKGYEADVMLGVETDTLDRTGKVVATRDVNVTREAVVAAMAARTGEHDQVPPMYSAIKHGGVRLYERARAGEEVERAARRVRIDRFELLDYSPPRLRVAIGCSKGTYVRSLCADLGSDLGCGAHVAELRRTRAGVFTIDQAVSLDAVVSAPLVPMADATGLPNVVTPAAFLKKVRAGLQMPVEVLGATAASFQLVDESGGLLAICHAEAGRIVYDRVFTTHFPA